MSKTITLRLTDDHYHLFSLAASEQHRSISNLIETLAFQRLEESQLVDAFEMEEIFGNKALLSRLEKGSTQAKARQGKFV